MKRIREGREEEEEEAKNRWREEKKTKYFVLTLHKLYLRAYEHTFLRFLLEKKKMW